MLGHSDNEESACYLCQNTPCEWVEFDRELLKKNSYDALYGDAQR